MLKNTQIDLVQDHPIKIIPNHHLVYSDMTLIADTYSPPSITITITPGPPGQK